MSVFQTIGSLCEFERCFLLDDFFFLSSSENMEQRKQSFMYSQGNEKRRKKEETSSLPLKCNQALGVGSGKQRVGRAAENGHSEQLH